MMEGDGAAVARCVCRQSGYIRGRLVGGLRWNSSAGRCRPSSCSSHGQVRFREALLPGRDACLVGDVIGPAGRSDGWCFRLRYPPDVAFDDLHRQAGCATTGTYRSLFGSSAHLFNPMCNRRIGSRPAADRDKLGGSSDQIIDTCRRRWVRECGCTVQWAARVVTRPPDRAVTKANLPVPLWEGRATRPDCGTDRSSREHESVPSTTSAEAKGEGNWQKVRGREMSKNLDDPTNWLDRKRWYG